MTCFYFFHYPLHSHRPPNIFLSRFIILCPRVVIFFDVYIENIVQQSSTAERTNFLGYKHRPYIVKMSFPDVENTTLSPLSLCTRIKYTERKNRIRFIRDIFIYIFFFYEKKRAFRRRRVRLYFFHLFPHCVMDEKNLIETRFIIIL